MKACDRLGGLLRYINILNNNKNWFHKSLGPAEHFHIFFRYDGLIKQETIYFYIKMQGILCGENSPRIQPFI